MSNTGRYHIWKRFPKPLREVLKPFLKAYVAMRGYPLDVPLSGFHMKGPNIQPMYINSGTYEPQATAAIMQVVKPGDYCVDVGAHYGYFTMLLAKLVGEGGNVVAFEAHPDNAAWVRTNVRLNGLQGRVIIENMAVSDGSQATLDLYEGRGDATTEWNLMGRTIEGEATQAVMSIPATSLDDYFAPERHINFVKMDIEGAEIYALPGMRRILETWRPFVFIEFHRADGWEARHTLTDCEYRLFNIRRETWVKPDENMDGIAQCMAIPQEKLDAWPHPPPT